MVYLRYVFGLIRGEIEYTCAPLPEIFFGVSARVKEPYRRWLKKTAEEMECRDLSGFARVWNRCTDKYLEIPGLKQEHKILIKEPGTFLGSFEKDISCRRISSIPPCPVAKTPYSRQLRYISAQVVTSGVNWMRVPVTFNSCTHPTTDNKEIKYKKQVVSLVISLINSLMYFLLLLIYLSYFSFCFSLRTIFFVQISYCKFRNIKGDTKLYSFLLQRINLE